MERRHSLVLTVYVSILCTIRLDKRSKRWKTGATTIDLCMISSVGGVHGVITPMYVKPHAQPDGVAFHVEKCVI